MTCHGMIFWLMCDVFYEQLRLVETYLTETINSHWCVMYFDITISNACPNTKELCLFSHLDSATSHTPNNSMHYVQVLLVTQLRGRRLSPNCLQNLDPCFLYLRGIFRQSLL